MNKFITSSVVAALTSNVSANEKSERCIGLAMSGGGAHGAYEAGALWGIYNSLEDKSDLEYDVVTGVSAGSINTGAMIVFDKGKEGTLVEFLSNAWEHLSSK